MASCCALHPSLRNKAPHASAKTKCIIFSLMIGEHDISPVFGKIFRSIGLRIDPSGMIHQTDRMFIIFITKSFRILLRMSGIITHQRDHPGTMKITGNYIYKTNQFFYHSFSSFSPQSITQASSIPYFDKNHKFLFSPCILFHF